MLCEPSVRAVVWQVQTPATFGTSSQPIMTLAPSRKSTVPVGGVTGVEVTVAVNVTFCPGVDGFGEDGFSVAVVSDRLTVCMNGEPVLSLELKLPSPG